MAQITVADSGQYPAAGQPHMVYTENDSAGQPGLPIGLRRQMLLASLPRKLTVQQRGAQRAPVQVRYGYGRAWFGDCLLAWTEHGICWLSLQPDAGSLAELRHCWDPVSLTHDTAGLAEWLARIACMPAADIPLHMCGTAFQLRVWSALLCIHPGYFLSYGDLAALIGKPRAARAVGQAVGANGIAVLVPCHRVLAADGGIGGYRWGPVLKQQLLNHEAQPALNITSVRE